MLSVLRSKHTTNLGKDASGVSVENVSLAPLEGAVTDTLVLFSESKTINEIRSTELDLSTEML